MSESLLASRKVLTWAILGVWLSSVAGISIARPPASIRKPARITTRVELDFALLASQRPWACPDQPDSKRIASTWNGEPAQCAWQNRLHMRRWSGQGGVHGAACFSEQARWWAWARGESGASAGPPQAWRSGWQTQSMRDESGAEQRVFIVQQLSDGNWSATEWRWNPSPRPATQRWQAGRWALLAERAAALHSPVAASPADPMVARLVPILETNIGARPAEVSNQVWRWEAAGMCLSADFASLGPQQLQLPYLIDDSRLEQRAAMQLLLARRHPQATWLTPFRLIEGASDRRGGAKFYAVWISAAVVKGQLWIPVKGGGPMVRLRIDSAAPAAPASSPDALARSGKVIARELDALAARWADRYE